MAVRRPSRRHDRMSDRLCDIAVTRRHDGSMAASSALDATYEAVGPRQALDRLLPEYGLNEEQCGTESESALMGPGSQVARPKRRTWYTSPCLAHTASFPALATTRPLPSAGASPRRWFVPSAFLAPRRWHVSTGNGRSRMRRAAFHEYGSSAWTSSITRRRASGPPTSTTAMAPSGVSRTLTPGRCHHPDKPVHAGFRALSERMRTSASRLSEFEAAAGTACASDHAGMDRAGTRAAGGGWYQLDCRSEWRDRRGRGDDTRVKDWLAWHAAYDDPSSALSARLRCVRSHLSDAVDRVPAGRVMLVSLCAGQGHDVIGVLPDHPRPRGRPRCAG